MQTDKGVHSNQHNYGSISTDEVSKDVESHEHVNEHEFRDKVTIMANTLNALLGVALFAMPWGFQQSGVIGGALVLIGVAFLSYETARILLVAQKVYFQQTGEIKGYPEIASAALGPMWYYVVQVTTIISCLGGCTGYIIFFGQTLGQAFDLPAETVILYATIPLVLLSWIRSFHELTFVTIFGVVALLSSVLILLIDGSSKLEHVASTPMVIPATVLNFVGSATFLFTIHYCVLSIGAESLRSKPWLAHNSECPASRRAFLGLETSIAASYLLAFVVIFVVGCCGYVMYRNSDLVRDEDGGVVGGCEQSVCQNVVLNISPGTLRNVVGVTMSMVIMFSYLVILAPAREHIENTMLSIFQPKSALVKNISQNALRTVLVMLNVIVAIRAPYFGNMLSAVGGLTDAFLCFVMPPLIFRVALRGELGGLQAGCYLAVVGWGIVVIVYTLEHVLDLAWVAILVAALVFETLRMLIAFGLARPSSEVTKLELERQDAVLEVGQIKSVQLEFVKHAKLSRKVIAIEKKIETLQAQYFPRLLKVRKVFRILRFVVYIGLGVYFGAKPVVEINPLILWPISWFASWFTSAVTFNLQAWFVLFVLGGTIRHILRSVLPLIFSATSFP